MNKLLTAAAFAAATSISATAALAQGELLGTDALDDRLDDIEEAVQEDLDRAEDRARFGNPEFRQGLSGSASLGYTGQSGNSESNELTLGVRLRHASGNFVQTLGMALDYTDVEGDSTKEDVFGVYDGNYYFNDRVYGFILGRVQSDGLAELATDTRTDAFLGFGPGYRVINTPDMTWRVQAGVGVSYLKNGIGESETEPGYIASSRFFYKFNDNVFATNDTDVLKSDTALRVNNDLGVNFKMTDSFATRVSYLTEYNESRAIRTDNKLGVSLVYGF
ncbi:MAG: DUF481 domain-containing protein [Paracoccaceae bacterium]